MSPSFQTQLTREKPLTTERQPELVVETLVDRARVRGTMIDGRDLSKIWLIGSLIVIGAAIALRFCWLTLKPFHHDEGVNGFFLTNLFRNNVYAYDPSNYHGPTLYYFALGSSYLFGLDDFALRFVTAIFGILTVILIFNLKRYYGIIGTLVAALFIALSPGMVFISRYFIHEMLFLFFTFGVVVCILRFIEGERPRQIAIVLTAILMLVCLLPATFNLAFFIGSDNEVARLVSGFVFFAIEIAIVYFVIRLLLKWNEGRPIYLILASASAVLTFATKETAFISFATMLIAAGCVWAWMRIIGSETNQRSIRRRHGFTALSLGLLLLAVYFRSNLWNGCGWFYDAYLTNAANKEQPLVLLAIIALFLGSATVWIKYLVQNWRNNSIESVLNEPPELNYQTFVARLGNSRNSSILILLCLGVFAFVGVLFFSSFFTHQEGVKAAFDAYNIWAKTGTKDHAVNGTWAYLKWLIGVESPLLILGALGSLIAFWQSKHRFAMFTALWAFGLFAAYTILPYKTPWLGINFVLPMGLIAGYGINELISSRQLWQRQAAIFLTILGIGICIYQTVELNFFRYDDDSRPYVYVQSKRSMNAMVREIKRLTDRAGTGKQASIIIASPENWPLPWTLHEYKNAVFHGQIVEAGNSEIIIGSGAQAAELEQKYSERYLLMGTYPLRPGVDLLLYVRRDLTQK